MSELGSPSSVDTPPPPQAHAAAPTSDPPQKRRKVDLACDECRARKVKCDGTRPVCDVCQRRKNKGAVCTYTTNPFRPQPTGLNVGTSSSTSGSARRQTPPVGREHHSQHQRPQQGYERPIQHTPTPVAREDSNSLGHSSRQHHSRNDESLTGRGVDAMTGVISGSEQTMYNDQGFFGSSSAGSFIQQIKVAIDEKLGVNGQKPALKSSLSLLPLSRTSTPGQRGANGSSESSGSAYSYVLPSRRKADSLLGLYWALVDPLYPFLDKKRFADFYKSLWEGKLPRTEEKVFVATLNVVFALSSQLADSVEPAVREQEAREYFQRAQNMIQLDIWDVGSIELIQCLLLMGQYLQSTSTPHQCWMVVGHAVRVAQGLGLHLPESSSALSDRRERELARRVWHACVMMDRVLSMTMGRPAMVSKAVANAVPLPEKMDMDYLHLNSQPADTPAAAAFYVCTLQLYDIVNDILLRFYNSDADNDKPHERFQHFHENPNSINMASVFELDEALMAWSRSLPKHLQYPTATKDAASKDSIFKRQAIVGRARFLYAKILLFRPVLSQFCLMKDPQASVLSEESITGRMALQCSGLCLRAAQDMIDLIKTHFDPVVYSGPIPAWWYCALYIYTSATVLLAARIRPLISSAVLLSSSTTDPSPSASSSSSRRHSSEKSSSGSSGYYSLDKSWAHARSILRAFECFGPSAQRYLAALDVLDASLAKKYPSFADAASTPADKQQQQQQYSKQQSSPASPVRYAPIVLRNPESRNSNNQQQQQQQQKASGASASSTSTTTNTNTHNTGGLSLNNLADAAVASGGSSSSSSTGTATAATSNGLHNHHHNQNHHHSNPTNADFAAAADFNKSTTTTATTSGEDQQQQQQQQQFMALDMDWLDMSWLSVMPGSYL